MAVRAVFHSRFELHLCGNSNEALKALREFPISIAILDIKMRGESGLDLLSQIKGSFPLVEVVMLTAYETPDAVKTALAHKVAAFLAKPFNVTVIEETVERALRLRSLTSSRP